MELYKEIFPYFPQIISEFSAEDFEIFKNTSPEKLIDYHLGLGTWVRNSFVYRNAPLLAAFAAAGISHPDDISDYIIKTLHQSVQISKKPESP